MKKIMVSLICIFTLFTLVACSKKTTTTVKRDTITILESDLEKQICDIAEFLDGATFCVLNYSSTESENATSLGSGVVYKREINANNTYTYYLLTNRHVIEDGEKFKVYTSGGSTITANRLGYSETYDIGILTFTAYDKYNVVPIGSIDDVKQGELCFAMGTPLYLSYVNTFTKGNVSAIREERIQHTADLNSGNSGGPLVNLNGELIGINVSKLSNNSMGQVDIDGMCFSIRCDKVVEAINEIEGKNDAVINPVLGITVSDLENVLAYDYPTFNDYWDALKEKFINDYSKMGYSEEYLEQKFIDLYSSKKEEFENNYIENHPFLTYVSSDTTSGMIVKNIVTDSACDKAGLKIGDVIVGINDITVTKQNDFVKEYYNNGIGDTILLVIKRNDQKLQVSVTL